MNLTKDSKCKNQGKFPLLKEEYDRLEQAFERRIQNEIRIKLNVMSRYYIVTQEELEEIES